MGLSERKNKQRIGLDPRNLTWSNDTSRFSYQHMTSLGWSSSSGIGGSSLEGNPNHIAVVRKLDNGGIGMARAKKEGDDQAAGAGQAGREFEDVLKRLAGGTPTGSGASTPTGETVEEAPRRSKGRMASRQKHLRSKQMASSSPAALAEILGVPVSSLPASPSPVPPPTTTTITNTTTTTVEVSSSSHPTPVEGVKPAEPERTAEETISTSTLSVADYFKQKLRAKMLSRQGASGSTTPEILIEPSPSTSKKHEEEWAGSRTTFDPSTAPTDIVFTESAEETAVAPIQISKEDEKAAKRTRKEARRLKKLEAEKAMEVGKLDKAKKKKKKDGADEGRMAKKVKKNKTEKTKGDKKEKDKKKKKRLSEGAAP